MPEPRARVAICGEKQGFGISQSDGEIGRVYRLFHTDCPETISGKEKKGRVEMVGEDGPQKDQQPDCQKNIKKLDRPGWVKA